MGVALYRSLVWISSVAQPSRRAVTVTDNSTKKVFVHTVSINKDKIIEVFPILYLFLLLILFFTYQTKKTAEQVTVSTTKQGITLLEKSPLASITDSANMNKEETASLLNLYNDELEVKKEFPKITLSITILFHRKTVFLHPPSNLGLSLPAQLCHPHLP